MSAAPWSVSAAFETCAGEVLRNQVLPIPAAGDGERKRIAVELLPDEPIDPHSNEQLLERIREISAAR